MSTPKRRRRRRTLSIIFAVVVFAAGAWALSSMLGAKPVNILLMGLDESKTRTDVVVLAHIDPKQGLINLLSLPRDTLVEIDCESIGEVCVTPDKLAHAHAYGGEQGAEVTVRTVEGLLGIQIDHYVRADFEGFKQVVDILGGVDLVIDQNMDYEDPYADPPLSIHFQASDAPQHLDGQAALEFVRFRGTTGDIGRTERTKQFLLALAQKAKETQSLVKLPSVISTGLQYVDTDIDTSTGLAIAKGALGADLGLVQMETLPGADDANHRRGWVWVADEAQAAEVVDRLIVNPKPPVEAPKEE